MQIVPPKMKSGQPIGSPTFLELKEKGLLMKTDRLYPLYCAAIVVACVVATGLVSEMGVDDDWQYAYIAQTFAASGHLVYTGLMGPMVGPMVGLQAVWAALLIKLFGFSFTILRLSTLPFAAGCGYLLYRLGRSFGLKPSFALFGSLSIALCPLFLPLAASFMTDIPGFFFWLACTYCGVLSLRASSEFRAAVWLAVVAVVGMAGGTVRQPVWIVPLVVLPAVAWSRRRIPPVMVSALFLWCATLVFVVACLCWFQTQPLVVRFDFSLTAAAAAHQHNYALLYGKSALRTGFALLPFLLPATLIYFAGLLKGHRVLFRMALVLLISGAILVLRFLLPGGAGLLLGNIVTTHGVLGVGTEAMGFKPVTLPALIRPLLIVLCDFGAGAALAVLIERYLLRLQIARKPQTSPNILDLRLFATLFAPACLAYALAIMCRGIPADRYLIPLLPALVIPLLWQYQQRIRNTPPTLGWILVGLFALYGVATTHDYLAAGRARKAAASALTANGIPRTSITAGLEYDGWTELEHSGRLIDADFVSGQESSHAANHSLPQSGPPYRIFVRSANGTVSLSPNMYPVPVPSGFLANFPSIAPVYVVAYSRLPGLIDATFPPIHYRAWLPPFDRQVVTQIAPGLPRRF